MKIGDEAGLHDGWRLVALTRPLAGSMLRSMREDWLLGRERETRQLDTMLGAVAARGGALIIRGGPGKMIADGHGDIALKLLATEAENGFWADRGGVRRRDALLAQALVVAPGADEARVLSIRAFSDPIGQGATVLEALSRFDTGGLHDPELSGRLGGAAAAVGDLELAERFCGDAVAGLRGQGRVVPLVRALVVSASTQIQLGRWARAQAEALEAAQLARETGQPVQEAAAEAACALVAALCGEVQAVESHASAAERLALTTGARGVLGEAQLARGLEALGAGRAADAFEHLWRLFEPGDPACHRFLSVRAIGYLAEAAAHGDRRAPVQDLLARLEPLAARTPSPQLQAAICQARALLAGDDEAERLFRAASAPDMPRRPFDWARLQLAYGVWLRRQRRAADSRSPLRTARDAFEALGAAAWSTRARRELRATGETCRRLTDETRDELTPQELQIAQLATEGLSNREIGARLYLSHRTIGSHLYRIFPKLGIASRAELRAALASGDLYAAA
jgi:DNA-binding CsgD family transcriptional regulator